MHLTHSGFFLKFSYVHAAADFFWWGGMHLTNSGIFTSFFGYIHIEEAAERACRRSARVAASGQRARCRVRAARALPRPRSARVAASVTRGG